MTLYNQTDPRWSMEKLGKSQSTVGRYGCLITAIMTLNSWYGGTETPGWAARNLSFTSGGLLFWKSLSEKMRKIRFVYRYYKEDREKILSILQSNDNAAILEVPFAGAKHWLALVGYSRLNGYRVADPLHGDIVWLKSRYSSVSGFAEITRL